jgi:uncharacterized protein YndB with AHSA1/START domain
MAVVHRSVTIAAKGQDVWRILTELDNYAEWESGYVSSAYTSDQHRGLGTRREVRLKSPMGVRRALHEVTHWEEDTVIAWAAIESNFPFLKTAEQTVTLRPEGGTTKVENRMAYELKYGSLGSLVDRLMFNKVVTGAAESFLESLKARAESGDR